MAKFLTSLERLSTLASSRHGARLSRASLVFRAGKGFEHCRRNEVEIWSGLESSLHRPDESSLHPFTRRCTSGDRLFAQAPLACCFARTGAGQVCSGQARGCTVHSDTCTSPDHSSCLDGRPHVQVADCPGKHLSFDKGPGASHCRFSQSQG